MTTTGISHDLRSATLAARHWRRLVRRVRPPGDPEADFSGPSVWVLLLTDEAGVSCTVELTDAVRPPDEDGVAPLVELLADLAGRVRLEEGCDPQAPVRVSLLRTRPGAGPATSQDVAWLSALEGAAARAGLPCVLSAFADRDRLLLGGAVLGRPEPAGKAG